MKDSIIHDRDEVIHRHLPILPESEVEDPIIVLLNVLVRVHHLSTPQLQHHLLEAGGELDRKIRGELDIIPGGINNHKLGHPCKAHCP